MTDYKQILHHTQGEIKIEDFARCHDDDDDNDNCDDVDEYCQGRAGEDQRRQQRGEINRSDVEMYTHIH